MQSPSPSPSPSPPPQTTPSQPDRPSAAISLSEQMTSLGSTRAGPLMEPAIPQSAQSTQSTQPPFLGIRTVQIAALSPDQYLGNSSRILENEFAYESNPLERNTYGSTSFSEPGFPVGNYHDADSAQPNAPNYSRDLLIQTDRQVARDSQRLLFYDNQNVVYASSAPDMSGLLDYVQGDDRNDSRFTDFQATTWYAQKSMELQQQGDWMFDFDQSVPLPGHINLNINNSLGTSNFNGRSISNQEFGSNKTNGESMSEINQGGSSLGTMLDPLLFSKESTWFSSSRAHCPWPGCTETFARASDINRHYQSIHLGMKHHCFWPGCPNNRGLGYSRAEKLRAHQKQKHEHSLS